jgi:predicted dehydrogenase/threonine dehydrogenase-like Zn-dependent dehydrogenase
MEQLTQQLKDGKMEILEVPFPVLPAGWVLVRNHYSMISAGTEGKTVRDARMGYLGKARARKDEVGKVLAAARTHGIVKTYQLVMNKLDAPSALGYSCAGTVMATGQGVSEFRAGDRVACGGPTAVHAEVIAVPANLCVRVGDTDLKLAAFTTLGAVALQGIRQADLRLGEQCVVIGLGLLGQLTVQLLRAGGIRAIGIDTDAAMTERARRNGIDLAIERGSEGLETAVLEQTSGVGADAVIITAGTDSHDPVDLAGVLCRKKGKVVVVGAVPTGFKRANYYRKELELRMSCSYGPGRYDPQYEERGLDYPVAYVRWTEKRNMQAFADLLREGKITLAPLVTHEFSFRDAMHAYDLILGKTEPYGGIVLRYDTGREVQRRVTYRDAGHEPSGVTIGLIGAGSFAQNFLLPALKDQGSFAGVVTARPHNAANIAARYKFGYASGDPGDIFRDANINTVFIASRHDSHAQYVLEALEHGKHVFVEKPLCLSEEELEQIAAAYSRSGRQLMVGFNRRFAPMTGRLLSAFPAGVPRAVRIRVNAGAVPADHWIQQEETGGGRIVGEACHFIDLARHFAGAPVQAVSAMALDDSGGANDTLTVNLRFGNGSIANICYFSNGHPSVPKEQIEVFGSGIIARLDDFKSLVISGRRETRTEAAQDKGHRQEVSAFCDAIRNGTAAPVPFGELHNSMLATFRVKESVALNGRELSV